MTFWKGLSAEWYVTHLRLSLSSLLKLSSISFDQLLQYYEGSSPPIILSLASMRSGHVWYRKRASSQRSRIALRGKGTNYSLQALCHFSMLSRSPYLVNVFSRQWRSLRITDSGRQSSYVNHFYCGNDFFNCRRLSIFYPQSLIENRAEDLTPQILQFQQIYANAWYELQLQTVDFDNVKHAAVLQHIYEQSGLDSQDAPQTSDYRKLGFVQNSPELVNEFLNAGVLGLHTLHCIATMNSEAFAAVSPTSQLHMPITLTLAAVVYRWYWSR